MSYKLGDQFAGFRVPDFDNALRPAASKDGLFGAQAIHGTFRYPFILAGIYLQLLPTAIEIPDVNIVVEATGYDPVRMISRGREAFHIVIVLPDGGGQVCGLRVWPPHSDRGIRRSRDESRIVLRQGDIVDPMRVGLDLTTEGGYP